MPLGLPDAFLNAGNSSFVTFLSELGAEAPTRLDVPSDTTALSPHGTTIVAMRGTFGAVMAGDRRATMGNIIAQRDIEKVFATDEHSLVGIAGSAGLAIELVRLFQVELEHYEKIEGTPLSIDGKANRLAALLRSNLGLAMQGLAVVPLMAGFDLARDRGRIFSYDVTGGRYEEHDFYAVGSGSVFARGSLKKLYRHDASLFDAVDVALEALYDAADDDSATGGPDLIRGIYPTAVTIETAGAQEVAEERIAALAREVIEKRSRTDEYGPGHGPNNQAPRADA